MCATRCRVSLLIENALQYRVFADKELALQLYHALSKVTLQETGKKLRVCKKTHDLNELARIDRTNEVSGTHSRLRVF